MMTVVGCRSASQSAIALLPAAVGPQTTGMRERSSPAKAALELVPGKMHHGRPAVNVVRRVLVEEHDAVVALEHHVCPSQLEQRRYIDFGRRDRLSAGRLGRVLEVTAAEYAVVHLGSRPQDLDVDGRRSEWRW